MLDNSPPAPELVAMMTPLLQVALGGALGASARFLTVNAMTRAFGAAFPYGTMAVNILGSFIMGILFIALARKGGMSMAPLLMTGVLGGFTTFSAFSLDAVKLFEQGAQTAAIGYILASVLLSILALVAGLYLARMVMA